MKEMTDPPEFKEMNNELLHSMGSETKESDDGPKRNSKDDLITKIIKLTADNDLSLDQSNTKLRRMTKTQLQKLLGETIQKVQQAQMAEQVGASRDATDRVIGLAALRMVHNICANCAEQGLNTVLPSYGYEIHGFSTSLQQPDVKEAVDACLAEIAADTDILSYIDSPYARLGIAWSGCLMTCMRRKRKPAPDAGTDPRLNVRNKVKPYVTTVGPQPPPAQLRSGIVRRASAGQVGGGKRPDRPDEKSV